MGSDQAGPEHVERRARRDHRGRAARDDLPRDPRGDAAVRAQPAFQESGAPALGDLLDVLRRRWRFLALNILATTLLALGISFLLPKWYEGRAVLLPPTADDLGASMISQLMPRGFAGLKMPGAPSLSDVFVAVLKSRTVADRIVRRFDLVRRYDVPDQETAVKELATHEKFRVGDEGTIAIIAEA